MNLKMLRRLGSERVFLVGEGLDELDDLLSVSRLYGPYTLITVKDNVNSRSRKSMSSFETRLISSTRELPFTQVRRPIPGCLFSFDEQSSLKSELLFVRLSSLFSLIILFIKY